MLVERSFNGDIRFDTPGAHTRTRANIGASTFVAPGADKKKSSVLVFWVFKPLVYIKLWIRKQNIAIMITDFVFSGPRLFVISIFRTPAEITCRPLGPNPKWVGISFRHLWDVPRTFHGYLNVFSRTHSSLSLSISVSRPSIYKLCTKMC